MEGGVCTLACALLELGCLAMVKEEELRAKREGLDLSGISLCKIMQISAVRQGPKRTAWATWAIYWILLHQKSFPRILLRILSVVAQHQDLADWISQLRYRPFVEA